MAIGRRALLEGRSGHLALTVRMAIFGATWFTSGGQRVIELA